MDTHQHSYVQYFFNVMSTSIAIQAMVAPGQPLGLTLKDIEDQSYKSCDTDKGMHSLPISVTCTSLWPADTCSVTQVVRLVGMSHQLFTVTCFTVTLLFCSMQHL